MDKTKNRADTLRDGGGHGGGTNAPAEAGHEQHIQHYIDRGGENEVIQGMLAITDGVEDAHENVVHHREDRAAEIESEILNGLGEYIGGSAHPSKDHGRQCHTGYCQYGACGKAKGNGGMDGLGHGVILFGTVGPGNDNAGTHGNTVEKTDHHKDEAAGRTYRCQSIITDIVSYAPGVKGIVELLKHVSQEHRKGEEQDRFPNRAFRQGGFLVQEEPFFL